MDDDKKATKPKKLDSLATRKKRNPKAFAINATRAADRRARRKQDILEKKFHVPVADRSPVEPPPVVVSVVGPPGVGKTTLIKSLVKYYTRHGLSVASGPITIVSGKKRRLTLIESNNDIHSMIDVAKISDLVLLMVDASFGFEMELFEFLNICQHHGFPKIMAILTHLDKINSEAEKKKVKKMMKKRFWLEIYKGAKLFFIKGLMHDLYGRSDTQMIARYISVMKFRPLTWQTNHSYVIVDRMEDLTDQEKLRRNQDIDRHVSLYGFVRGIPMTSNSDVHIPGCGDFRLTNISKVQDPCPLPIKTDKQRNSLNQKERMVYAPFCGVGGVICDKDAVYIEIAGSHSFSDKIAAHESDKIVTKILNSSETIDEKMKATDFKFFTEKAANDMLCTSTDGENQLDNSGFEYDSEPTDIEMDIDDDVIEDNPLYGRFKSIKGNSIGLNEKYAYDDDEDDDEHYVNFDVNVKKENEKFDDDDEIEDEDIDEEIDYFADMDEDKAEMSFYQREKNNVDVQKLVYGTEVYEGTENSIESSLNIKVEFNEKMYRKLIELSKDKFVTGKWDPDEDAFVDENDDLDDEEYDEFEDLEEIKDESEKFIDSSHDEVTCTDDQQKSRLLEKMKKKNQFDAQYDMGDLDIDKLPEKTFYDIEKGRLKEQSDKNLKFVQGLDEDVRLQVEGYRPGLYVRIELEKVPSSLVENFDPSQPLIIGGLNPGELSEGYVRVRMKKHRWYKRILKTNDPLIISMGWRRFQTVPIYHVMDDNMRNRALKYTPWHLHCLATFWSPIAPQGTGFVAFQQTDRFTNDFRVAATGVVIDLDKSSDIVKKLKLVGYPLQVFTKTAFIRGMFASPLEVTRFEGAPIRTVSGIRGIIKKAIRNPAGAFRAAFEDKILMSDIVFLRTWFSVDVPKLYITVKTLLMTKDERSKWCGARTIGRIRFEEGLKCESAKRDSIYKPVDRKNFNFRPLTIPKKLQKELPYKDKPKFQPKQIDPITRQSAIKNEEEKKRIKALTKMGHLKRARMMRGKNKLNQ